MRHLDEGTIHAWLDGALSPDEAARAEAHVGSCTVCADAVAEARGLIAASSRILTALDAVPGGVLPSAEAAQGSRARPRLFATWLVRERIAAVVALVVAGGALAMALSRDNPRAAAVVELASERVQPVELAVADSPLPPPAAAQDAGKEVQANRAVGRRAVAPSVSRERELATARQADSLPLPGAEAAARLVPPPVAAAPPVLRTDDTLRLLEIAQAQREQDLSAEAKSSLVDKLRVVPGRGAVAEGAARFAEPRGVEPNVRGAVGEAYATGAARLVQEERMTEGGREVRRRIYRIDDILVTLDERLPEVAGELRRARVEANAAAAALPAAPDTTLSSTNTIRWTDARGAELTLTGPASQERLERIRKLLGY